MLVQFGSNSIQFFSHPITSKLDTSNDNTTPNKAQTAHLKLK